VSYVDDWRRILGLSPPLADDTARWDAARDAEDHWRRTGEDAVVPEVRRLLREAAAGGDGRRPIAPTARPEPSGEG